MVKGWHNNRENGLQRLSSFLELKAVQVVTNALPAKQFTFHIHLFFAQ